MPIDAKPSFKLLATAASGIETLVKRELQDLGYNTIVDNGKVFFNGSWDDIATTNLWLRTADRIKIVYGEFKALTFSELFDQTYALPWDKLLPVDANFPVSGKSLKSKLFSVPDCQAIVKKAIAKKLQDVYHRLNQLPETGALYPIEVAIRKNQVQISIDTTGSSLFKRGYRVDKGTAPLKENMAAALILLTNWHSDKPFIDPFCGSGTIPIEAALIGQNTPPGFNRSFISEKWLYFPTEIWDRVRATAEEKIDYDIQLNIYASDIDGHMIEIAKRNAEEAGVLHQITFKQQAIKDFKTSLETGTIVTNPPYGDRLNNKDDIVGIYQTMGSVFAPLTGFSKYILTSDEQFELHFGSKATRKRKLYNGAIKVDYYQYWSKKKG